jgi:hypothetical protein
MDISGSPNAHLPPILPSSVAQPATSNQVSNYLLKCKYNTKWQCSSKLKIEIFELNEFYLFLLLFALMLKT